MAINIYEKRSHRCNHYIFLLRDEPLTPEDIAGLEKQVNEKMAQLEAQRKHEQLEKDYAELQEDYDKLEKEKEQLEERVEELKAECEKSKPASKLIDTLASLGGAYLANPEALNGLAGLFGKKSQAGPQGAAGNKPLNGSDSGLKTAKCYSGNITQKDVDELELAIIPFYKEADVPKVRKIHYYLCKDYSFIPVVLESLEEANKKLTGQPGK
jgi:anti-sigma28 factor (negative regulator of flagellin synthesis)